MLAQPYEKIGAPRRPDLGRFVLATLIAPGLLAIFALWLGDEYFRAVAMRQEARAAFAIRSEAGAIIARVCDAESSQRGYVLTGDPDYLAAYRATRTATHEAFVQLAMDPMASPAEVKLRSELRTLALRKFVEMDRVIESRTSRGLFSAVALVQDGTGKALMDRMRRVSEAIVVHARQERDGQTDRYDRRFHTDAITTFIAILAVGFVLVGKAVAIWRQRLSEHRAQLAAFGNAERNRAILDSTGDGIVIFDPGGTIETANAAAAKLLGYRPEELVGRNAATLVKRADRSTAFDPGILMIDGRIEHPVRPDLTIVHREGHELSVDVALGLVRLPDGDRFVASIHDISERKHIDRIKDELISTISHELRTPLTSVIGALGLLRSGAVGPVEAAPARLIEIAENNSRRLIRLINDMLDVDRHQSGQLQLFRRRCDLRDVVARACEGSQGASAAAKVALDCSLPMFPVETWGDADRLLQVVTNLASNAIRVSAPAQTVRIGLSVGGEGKATVTVDDDGPGIPPEFRGRIFGRFERAAREEGGGTGLGLAISREIVTGHGGNIWFEDRPSGGTRFAVSLDLASTRLVAKEPPDTMRLLICEDEPDIAETIYLMVERMGFAADCVSKAETARAALRESNYDVLLLDVELPDENGLSLLTSLREPGGALPLPVIVISALRRDGPGLSIPGDIVAWIDKPVNADCLAAALRSTTCAAPEVA